MYRKYRDSLFNIRYLYPGKKYCDVSVHWCIVAGLLSFKPSQMLGFRTHLIFITYTSCYSLHIMDINWTRSWPGFIAQLVEHCTCIVEVMDWNRVGALLGYPGWGRQKVILEKFINFNKLCYGSKLTWSLYYSLLYSDISCLQTLQL